MTYQFSEVAQQDLVLSANTLLRVKLCITQHEEKKWYILVVTFYLSKLLLNIIINALNHPRIPS